MDFESGSHDCCVEEEESDDFEDPFDRAYCDELEIVSDDDEEGDDDEDEDALCVSPLVIEERRLQLLQSARARACGGTGGRRLRNASGRPIFRGDSSDLLFCEPLHKALADITASAANDADEDEIQGVGKCRLASDVIRWMKSSLRYHVAFGSDLPALKLELRDDGATPNEVTSPPRKKQRVATCNDVGASNTSVSKALTKRSTRELALPLQQNDVPILKTKLEELHIQNMDEVRGALLSFAQDRLKKDDWGKAERVEIAKFHLFSRTARAKDDEGDTFSHSLGAQYLQAPKGKSEIADAASSAPSTPKPSALKVGCTSSSRSDVIARGEGTESKRRKVAGQSGDSSGGEVADNIKINSEVSLVSAGESAGCVVERVATTPTIQGDDECLAPTSNTLSGVDRRGTVAAKPTRSSIVAHIVLLLPSKGRGDITLTAADGATYDVCVSGDKVLLLWVYGRECKFNVAQTAETPTLAVSWRVFENSDMANSKRLERSLSYLGHQSFFPQFSASEPRIFLETSVPISGWFLRGNYGCDNHNNILQAATADTAPDDDSQLVKALHGLPPYCLVATADVVRESAAASSSFSFDAGSLRFVSKLNISNTEQPGIASPYDNDDVEIQFGGGDSEVDPSVVKSNALVKLSKELCQADPRKVVLNFDDCARNQTNFPCKSEQMSASHYEHSVDHERTCGRRTAILFFKTGDLYEFFLRFGGIENFVDLDNAENLEKVVRSCQANSCLPPKSVWDRLSQHPHLFPTLAPTALIPVMHLHHSRRMTVSGMESKTDLDDTFMDESVAQQADYEYLVAVAERALRDVLSPSGECGYSTQLRLEETRLRVGAVLRYLQAAFFCDFKFNDIRRASSTELRSSFACVPEDRLHRAKATRLSWSLIELGRSIVQTASREDVIGMVARYLDDVDEDSQRERSEVADDDVDASQEESDACAAVEEIEQDSVSVGGAAGEPVSPVSSHASLETAPSPRGAGQFWTRHDSAVLGAIISAAVAAEDGEPLQAWAELRYKRLPTPVGVQEGYNLEGDLFAAHNIIIDCLMDLRLQHDTEDVFYGEVWDSVSLVSGKMVGVLIAHADTVGLDWEELGPAFVTVCIPGKGNLSQDGLFRYLSSIFKGICQEAPSGLSKYEKSDADPTTTNGARGAGAWFASKIRLNRMCARLVDCLCKILDDDDRGVVLLLLEAIVQKIVRRKKYKVEEIDLHERNSTGNIGPQSETLPGCATEKGRRSNFFHALYKACDDALHACPTLPLR
ncbi:unnamed protein product [Amoebophrya sp. A25]|nr:unnamed protein product [Amoebophrya sp. A25]|eukprot:GSA25T00005858001.1